MRKITRYFLLIVAIVASGTFAKAGNTECAGTLTTAATGSFTLGYNYTFTTVGADVTITFELLDTKVGLVPQLVTPGNTFLPNMTLVSGQKYTYTLANQSIGSTITYACFFAFSGGAVRTTDLTYTVGNTCSGVTDNVKPVMVSAALVGTPTSGSAVLHLVATDNITNPVILFQAVDAAHSINKTLTADASGNATISGLNASTTYNLTISAVDAAANFSANTIPVSITTVMSPIFSGIDFEPTGNGASWTWNAFEAGGGTFAVAANPATTGKNSSANCGKLTYGAASSMWLGVECAHGSIGLVTLSASNCFVRMMVYKSTISQVGFKLATSSSWAKDPKYATNTKINEWEELTFDFTSYIGAVGQPEPYDQFAIHPDNTSTRAAGTLYIDNIKFGSVLSGISEVQAASFKMYPTFTSGKCAVSADTEIAQIVVRNIMGQTVQTISVNSNQTNLDLSSCAAGNYFVNVKMVDGKTGIQKLIKL